MGPEQLAYKLAEVREAELLLIGRITYDLLRGRGPSARASSPKK